MREDQEDIYIKFLKGELTEDEINQLKSSGEYTVLEKLMTQTDSWKLPPVKNSFQEFKQKKLAAKPKSNKSWLRIAASIAILIGVSSLAYFRFFNISTYTTSAGESLAIVLPDGCEVLLNGNSELSYNNWNWKENREVEMKGQAYFDIGVKGPFHVSFNGGSVDVVGTEFDVMSHNEVNVVKCFEGTVDVTFDNQTHRLNHNMGVRQTKGEKEETFEFEGLKSSWMEKYTQFENAPFNEVISALELRFGLEFNINSNLEKAITFTGQFPNNDEDIALKMVFESLGILYEKNGNIIVIH